MKKISMKVQKDFCLECSMALRRFIGNINGIESVDLGDEAVDIVFDETKIKEQDLIRISQDSIEKLGYKLSD